MKERIATVMVSVIATLGILEATPKRERVLDVDRLIVRQELIVSDTGEPWEQGYDKHQIARGIYARSVTPNEVGGLWVRSRLIKGEIDDPFDDRFHALERDGSLRKAPGHISWNVWIDDHWRQMAILQGEGLEYSEVSKQEWNGGTHPGRIRFQTFRPGHPEPLTDMLVGQGRISLGGGGFGGGGLPFPQHGIDVWGGTIVIHPVATPDAPRAIADDSSGGRAYALVAVDAAGSRSAPSSALRTTGYATLEWDSTPGADAYIVLRDGKEVTPPLRIEGSKKTWLDPSRKAP